MKRYFNSLPIRVKLVVPMVGALAVMLISVYAYFPKYQEDTFIETYTRVAARTADLFSVAVTYALNQHSFELLQKILQHAQNDANILYIFLFENNEVLASYNPHDMAPPHQSSHGGSSCKLARETIMVTQKVLGNEEATLGRLVLGYSLEKLYQTTREVQIFTIVFTLVSFVFGLFVINRVSERITRSISRLHGQMQEIVDKGSYSSDVRITASDEVGRLAAAFNKMMQELRARHERLAESQRRYRTLNRKLRKLNRLKTVFVSDASHNLRTPLTIIQGEVEVAMQRDRKPSEYQETLQIVQEETRHLAKIVENLLTLAKADTGNLLVFEDAVNISTICENLVRHVQILANDKGVQLNAKIKKNCFVTGDPNRLAEAILNLLENAVKYTPEDQSILFNLESENHTIVVKVADRGIGIPEDELSKIFERFYRAKNSIGKAHGSGLGLAICESIVKAHDGEIRVTSAPGKGSTFEVRLKRLALQPPAPTRTAELAQQS